MDRNERSRKPLTAVALDDPDLAPAELLRMLRNRNLAGELLARIAGEPRWTARNTIRRALVLHPNTPLAVARNLVPFLYWRELVEAATAPHVDAVVRRQAERRLVVCLDAMATGERVTLARIAPRAVIPMLIVSRDDRVIASVLDNPRLVEADVVTIARRASTGAAGATARHSRWGRRREVRLALVRNPNTPVDAALRIVHTLDRRDVDALIPDASVPNVVRIAAKRRVHSGVSSLRGGRA